MKANQEITKGIESNIWSALKISLEKNNKQGVGSVFDFIVNVLYLSIRSKSSRHFDDYINFPSYLYTLTYSQLKTNPAVDLLHNHFTELSIRTLKEIIRYGLNSNVPANQTDKDIQGWQIFQYGAFNSFSRTLFYMLSNGDFKNFDFTLDQFEQITGIDRSTYYSLRMEKLTLELHDQQSNRIDEIDRIMSTLKSPDNYKRHVLAGLKYWIVLLYQEEKIDAKSCKLFFDKIQIFYDEPDDCLSDILFFRGSRSYSYFNWNGWDHEQRPEGKIYSPPSPKDWLTFGFLIDQLISDNLFINLDKLDLDGASNIKFLKDDLENYLTLLEKEFDKWNYLLNIADVGELKNRGEKILNKFKALKHKQVSSIDATIAKTSLSPEKISEFKVDIGASWYSNARIHRLFEKLGNYVEIKAEDVKLKWLGQRLFMDRAKSMFIDGSNHHKIFGMSDIGSQIGRWEDDFFFETIFDIDAHKVAGSDIVDAIEKAIAEVSSFGHKVDLMFLSPEYSYIDKKLLNDGRFISKLNIFDSPQDPSVSYLGKFDGVDIYTTYSLLIKNKVVVCNFKEAFEMQYKKRADWFQEKLNIDILEISDEVASKKLEENEAKWKQVDDDVFLSEGDALTAIKTSVILDIWTTIDFTIKRHEAYAFGIISSNMQQS